MNLTRLAVATLAMVAILPAQPAAADSPDTAPPGPPGRPTVTDITYTDATMTWAPAVDDRGVVQYGIWRRTPDRGDMFYNATSATTFRFGGLTPGTSYTFFVVASDERNNGPASPAVTFQTRTAPAESEPPNQPGTPTVTAISPATAELAWTPSTDNVAVIRYLVYRLSGTTRTLFTYADAAANVRLQFLVPDRDYAFVVVAEDPAGNRSEASGTVRLRPPPDPAAACRVASAGPSPAMPGMHRVAVTYTGAAAVMRWSVRLVLPAGTTISWAWSAWEQDGGEVVFWYEGWADTLTPGETINLDMALTGPGLPDPASVRLNGATCDRQV
ncbi:fibronectin type III domain-containing protein [Micromonospora sp. CPCC 206061]|uniref:fibronectin type III domain-containing protein n=1 Tax=Micromonospora sp. CPCC 206061 TaxID=3122410 RepID=UPI002FEE9D3A